MHQCSITNEFDIIDSTETWLKPEIFNENIIMEGYNIFRSDRYGTKGGEVLLYVKVA